MRIEIREYETVTSDELALIVAHYPSGFSSDDLVAYIGVDGTVFRCLQLPIGTRIILFKINEEYSFDSGEELGIEESN